MKREIYVVNAKVVDASNGYSDVTGYPASFDSRHNNNDIGVTEAKAYASYYDACSKGSTAKANGRPLTVVTLMKLSTGTQIEGKRIGEMPELPDPTYAVTVTNGSGSGNYVAGATVSIVADELEGKEFTGWATTTELEFVTGDASTVEASFLMPAEAVAIEATYEDVPEPEPEEDGGEE